MNAINLRALVFSVLALLMASANATHGEGGANRQWHKQTLKFDVAERGSKFVFDEAPLLPSGFPAYGNAFVTQGYIYPYGKLGAHDGVNEDGSPEFPDQVIGEWTCRGFFIGNGAETVTGPWVITTQHYDFYKRRGYAENKQSTEINLVSDGYELVDIDVPGKRAITGGTGRFKRAQGEAIQVLLGHNANEGVNLRFRVRVD